MTPVEECIEKVLPPGVGRLLNYCSSTSLQYPDLFNGMSSLYCVHILLRGLLLGSRPTSETSLVNFEQALDVITRNCSRSPQSVSTAFPESAIDKNGNHIVLICSLVAAFLFLALVVPALNFFLRPSHIYRSEEKREIPTASQISI